MKNYSSWVEKQTDEIKTTFDTLKKLSQNFSNDNKVAQDLDQMLYELMNVEAESPVTPIPPSVETKKIKPEKKAIATSETDKSELIQRFEDLFSALTKPQIISYELPDRVIPAFNKPSIQAFQQVVDDLLMGNNVFLVGGAGTGKTYMAENLVAKMALQRKHITINCSQWTSPIEIIGGQSMDGYVEGKLIEAWTNGYVLILDELPKIDSNTAGLFNDALAKTKLDNAIIFNGRKESFKKHKDFACIATGNIYPDKESMAYGANNKQDLSLLDRFSGCVYFIEKNPLIERQVVANDMLWSICNKLRSAVDELKYEAQLSLRFMQTARDAFALEMKRFKVGKSGGINANDGKTFKSAIDSYLSTFTEIQRKNLMDRINYNTNFANYQYRQFDTNKLIK